MQPEKIGERAPGSPEQIAPPSPTTQTSEKIDSMPPDSHAKAALLQLNRLRAQGAASETIRRAEDVVAEAAKIDKARDTETARADVAAITGTGESTPTPPEPSHLAEESPTEYVKPYPVITGDTRQTPVPISPTLPPPPPPLPTDSLQGPALAQHVRQLHDK